MKNMSFPSLCLHFVIIFIACFLSLPGLVYAGPELEVRLDGVLQSSDDAAQFDPTSVGDTDQLVLTMRNVGDADLVFSTNPVVILGGVNADQFSLIQPALEIGNKLSPNSSTAFAVRFSPIIDGFNFVSDISIATNDPSSPFLFNFTGATPIPSLEIQLDTEVVENGSELFVEPTAVGETEQVVLTMRNVGTSAVQFLSNPPVALTGVDVAQFTIVQPALELGNMLSPNSSTAFAIRYSPTEISTAFHQASIVIETDDVVNQYEFDFKAISFRDCNNNNVIDSDDIESGTSVDCNANSIPDECEFLADSDGDETPDVCEACPNDSQKVEGGLCGCGVADTDTDNDGLPNCLDGCPEDPEKSAVGFCGCGVSDIDENDNGVPDCEGDADFVHSLALLLREVRRSSPAQDSEILSVSQVRAQALLASLSNSVSALVEIASNSQRFDRLFGKLPRFVNGTFEGKRKRRRKMRKRAIRTIRRMQGLI